MADDCKALIAQVDDDNSGTIDEDEFEKLMGKMLLAVEPGQFAAIDKDGSVPPPSTPYPGHFAARRPSLVPGSLERDLRLTFLVRLRKGGD